MPAAVRGAPGMRHADVVCVLDTTHHGPVRRCVRFGLWGGLGFGAGVGSGVRLEVGQCVRGKGGAVLALVRTPYWFSRRGGQLVGTRG